MAKDLANAIKVQGRNSGQVSHSRMALAVDVPASLLDGEKIQ